MLAYWNNTFYLEYLSNPVGEHVPPGQTLLMTSKDGVSWSDPVVIFPPYKVPDDTTKGDYPGVAEDLYAVMHQRMGFYVSAKRVFTGTGILRHSTGCQDDPNDGNGIGRVVREVKIMTPRSAPFTLYGILKAGTARSPTTRCIPTAKTRALAPPR